MKDELILVGLVKGAYEHACRVYDPRGIAPTLTTIDTGGLILERNNQDKDE